MKYLVTILDIKESNDPKIMSKSVRGLIKPLKKFATSTTIHFRVDKTDIIAIGDTETFEEGEFSLTEVSNDNGTFTLFKVI